MNEWQPLIDDLYREQIQRARLMTPGQRMRASFEATGHSIAMMRSALRHQYPQANEDEILTLSRQRIALVRSLDEANLYRTVERFL